MYSITGETAKENSGIQPYLREREEWVEIYEPEFDHRKQVDVISQGQSLCGRKRKEDADAKNTSAGRQGIKPTRSRIESILSLRRLIALERNYQDKVQLKIDRVNALAFEVLPGPRIVTVVRHVDAIASASDHPQMVTPFGTT